MLGNGLFSTLDRGKTKRQKDFLVALPIEEHYNLHIMRRTREEHCNLMSIWDSK